MIDKPNELLVAPKAFTTKYLIGISVIEFSLFILLNQNGRKSGARMSTPVPDWLNAELFVSVLEKNVENFVKVCSFKAKTAFGGGENYLSLLWAVELEVFLKDGSMQTIKYLLKVPPTEPETLAIVKALGSFEREKLCYYELIPCFEEIFRKAGKPLRFAPNAYQFDKDLGFDCIFMADARTDGYANVNRLEGLDMKHTKLALKRLAEFHAASALYISEHGRLPGLLMDPILTEATVGVLVQSQAPQEKLFLECLPLYNAEHMKEKIRLYQANYIDEAMAAQPWNPKEFNVLSHGDYWANNILFRHDKEGNLESALIIDYQAGRITSPAVDLQFFLLSSTALKDKLQHFDYYVKFYHDHLVKNLQVLNYPKPLPTLKELHVALFNYSIIAYTVVLKALPTFLLDPHSEGEDVHKLMYTSERYCSHMQQILPWMDNRGYFG